MMAWYWDAHGGARASGSGLPGWCSSGAACWQPACTSSAVARPGSHGPGCAAAASLGDGDPNLFGQVGELPAGGRPDVRRIQGGAKLVLADAQLRDRAAELLDALA